MNNSELILHPFYIARVAGVSVDLLSHTETGILGKILTKKDILLENISMKKDDVCGLLERRIHGNDDKELVRQLLKVKRAFYNKKLVDPATIDSLVKGLVSEEYQAVCNYNNLLIDSLKLNDQLKDEYVNDIEISRRSMHKLWSEPFLQDALAYSNPKLFRDIDQQIRDSRHSGKKRQLIEDTLLQYFLRSATKTSPLSTFTLVSVAEWAHGNKTSFFLELTDEVTNKLELKSAILREAIDRSLVDFSGVKEKLPLRLNPTIKLQENNLVFNTKVKKTASNNRVWGTLETGFTVKINTMLKCVFHVFQSEKSSMIFDHLLTKILQLSSSLVAEDVAKYIEYLYSVGIIQPEINLFEQENILTATRKVAGYFSENKRNNICDIVEKIEVKLAEYATSHAHVRAQLTESIAEDVKMLPLIMVAPDGMEIFGPEFYENSYIPHKSQTLETGVFEQFQEPFALLLDLAPLTDIAHYGQSQFADYFVGNFGVDGVCHTPTTFLTEVDAAYNPGMQSAEASGFHPAEVSNISQRHSEALEIFEKYILECFENCNGQDIELSTEKLTLIIQKIPQEINNRCVSNSYMGHLSSFEGKNRFVLNQVFGGKSFLFSRFLEMQTDEEILKIKQYLENSTNSARQLELPGVFGFDANRHPQMLDEELSIPGFFPNWQNSNKIHIDELSLKYDANTHRVNFFDSENKLVDIWYQGFLVPMLLPQTQRVIAVNNGDGVSAIISAVIMKSKFIVSGKICVFPRVSLGGVILFRRTTIFFREHIPDPAMDSFEFYKNIQTWKAENNLPNEVFIRLSLLSMEFLQGYGKNIAWEKFSYKDSKPFYLKLDNPRMVRLFARALKRNDFPVSVTEVLPSMSDQHISINGRPHVSELLFEITKKLTSSENN